MNDEVVINLFKKVARILEDDKQYEWLADEVKDYLNEIYVNKAFEPEQEQEPEPLTPRQGLEEYKKGYYQAELDLKREPLSDEEVIAKYRAIAVDNALYVPTYYAGFRDAEKAHGIGVNDE